MMHSPVKPVISLITAVYNGESTIEATLKSVINQSVFDLIKIEHIIIDGSSTDNTMSIVKKYAENYSHIRFLSEQDTGIYNAFNKGLKTANGEIIGIINSDDIYCESTLEIVHDAFFTDNELEIVHGNMLIEYKNAENYISRPNTKKIVFPFMMPYKHPTCFIKATVYHEIGYFDEWYKVGGDHDLIMRAIKANKKIRYIPDILVIFRDGGISSTQYKYKEKIRICNKQDIPKVICHLATVLIYFYGRLSGFPFFRKIRTKIFS